MAYSWLENLFCKTPILHANSYEKANMDLASQIAELQSEKANLAREMNSLLESADQSNQQSLKKIADLESKISELNTQINALNQQINQNTQTNPLFSRNFNRLPEATQKIAISYMDKYPEAYVTYGGRYWGVGRSKYNLDVKAWCLEGQNDQAVNALLNECNGKVSKVIQENPSLTFHQACDISIMRIKAKIGGMVTYAFDSQTWGSDEFWQFASETISGKLGDCEDMAILNFVACRAAGVPGELLRIVAGMTFTDEGHCSNTYLSSDLQWRHINSTTNYPASRDVKTLPLFGDSSENLNFKNLWFASTDNKTFHWFETASVKKEALTIKEDMFLKFIEIFNMDGKRVV